MEDASYYSDEESVCLGLTFTHPTKAKVQSSTHSTDSGVECPHPYGDRHLLSEPSHVAADHDAIPKFDNDSGCDVKHHDMETDLNSIYPGISDSGPHILPSSSSSTGRPPKPSHGCEDTDVVWSKARALAEKARAKLARELGGIEGGKKAPLTARSLDVLNSKLETSTKFQRCNLRSPDLRKRKCSKNPDAMATTQRSTPNPIFKSTQETVIYENVKNGTFRKRPEYINFRPILNNTRVLPNSSSSTSSTPSSKHPTMSSAGLCTAVYNTPVKRNYKTSVKPTPDSRVSPVGHYYERIKTPTSRASSPSYYCSSSPTLSSSPDPSKYFGPDRKRKGEKGTRPKNTGSPDKTLVEHCDELSRTLSPGEVVEQSYEEYRCHVLRQHIAPKHPLNKLRAFTPELSTDGSISSYHHAIRSARLDSTENPLYTRSSTKEQPQGREADSHSHKPSFSEWSDDIDSESWAYEKAMDVFSDYDDGEEWCLNCNSKVSPAGNDCPQCGSPGYTLSTPEPTTSSGLSETIWSSAKEARPKKTSRFRYSTSNIWAPGDKTSKRPGDIIEEEEAPSPKRGIVLIQATVDDIHSLHKIPDNIFELRFVDSGVTPEILQLLPELCQRKDVTRIIFEDCELDEWSVFGDVIAATRVAHIGFHSSNVGDEGAVALSNLLNRVPTIASLDLVGARVKCAGLAALGVSLMQNTTLKALNISDNPFEVKGAGLFFRALKGGNTTLQYLNVSGTCCGVTGVVVMVGALLLRNTPLLHLNLNNTNLTDDGLALISESLAYNTHLSSLCIAGNDLNDASAHELSVTLSDSESMQHVTISDNQLSTKGLEVLIESITVKSCIRRLDLSKNCINPEQYVDLVRKVEDLGLVGIVQI